MSETTEFLVERLRSEGEKTVIFFTDLADYQWEVSVYTEGSLWKVRDVLAHFVTAEQSLLRLFQAIVAGGIGVGEGFDIDRFNASQQLKTKDLDPSSLLKQFESTRKDMINFVGYLTESDLRKQGRHPFLGITSLSEMVKLIYRHNQLHNRDIKRMLVD
jgi:hypothetical protein